MLELEWIRQVSLKHVLMVLAGEVVANILGVLAAIPFIAIFHSGGIVVFIPLIIVTSVLAAVFVRKFDAVNASSVFLAAAIFLAISLGIALSRHEHGQALQNGYIYPLAIGYIFWSMVRRKKKI